MGRVRGFQVNRVGINNMELPLNKIIHADCLDFMKTLPDKCIDLVLTDPPYGMAYQSSWRTDKHDLIAFDDGENTEWVIPFLKESYRVLKDDTHIYIFCNDYLFSKFREWMPICGFTLKRTLVWIKNNHTSGDLEGDYGNKTEWCIFAHKGRRILNGERNTNVLNFSRVSDTDDHPTPKPVDMFAFLIEKSTNENEIVLDMFAGSCTTAVACSQINRKYICIEKEEQYVKVCNMRLDSMTKQLF